MLFMVTYAITQEKLRETQIQFARQEENWYGMELVGRWHQPSHTGVLILRTDDAGALAKWAQQWNAMIDLEIFPVNDDAGVREVLEVTLA
jgi:hypothetical protein